jgi:hypothetical protein
MHVSPLLGPVVALVAWSLVMYIWMYVARIGAMRRAGISARGMRGTRGLDGIIPAEANWPAHNYAHLMEQPTIFYAIVFALVLIGFDHPINVYLAWAYVVLRVVHSLIQATVNIVIIRFAVFTLSSLCLIGLTTHAAIYFIHHG